MSMLLELYGTPAIIRTQYPTRQHPDCVHPRKQVQCRCGDWSDLTHNSYCTGCAIWLVDELPAARPVVATVEQVKEVTWDNEFDEPYTAPNEELSAQTLELIAADTTPLILDEPLALEQPPVWMQPENATEAEQDALIAKLAFEADAQVDRQRYFAARSGKYVLLHQRADGLAVNCSCGDRVHRGRRAGRACKHMRDHNAMLTPAKKQQQEAA